MVGNVREWCADDFSKDKKVLRGGSWLGKGWWNSTTVREPEAPHHNARTDGFRCVADDKK
jgi:formylglycine-generating enzyme required for sulfatase activity